MKALLWYGPRQLDMADVDLPEVGDRDVLVEIAACGVCGSDLHGYLGHSSARVPPLILGHEIGGVVTGAGRLVDSALVGERVAVNPLLTCGVCDFCLRGADNLCPSRALLGMVRPGGFATHVVVSARNIVVVAHDVRRAAIVEPLANAVHALAAHRDPAALAVAGGGPVGLAILLLARDRGIPVRMLTEPSSTRRALALELGAATVAADPAEFALADLAAPGAQLTIDAVGTAAVRRDVLSSTASGGTAVMLGLEAESSEISFADLVRREIRLRGGFAYTREEFGEAARLLGAPMAADFVAATDVEPLANGAAVFAALADRRDPRMKILLDPRHSTAGVGR